QRGAARFVLFDAKIYAGAKSPGREPPRWLRGLVFGQTRVARVSLPGRWTARTVVVRDQGIANRLAKPQSMEPVRLVDPAFEKIFEVFSTDQIEARALLNPALMERLTSLEDLFEGGEDRTPAVAVFEKGALLLASPCRPPMTAPGDADRLARDAEISFERLIDEIETLMGVVDALAGPPRATRL
ncbi:MAG: DUF3137 domain-containing protein, partial [Caulobacterales bacterium]|nr:DUF3137 domain-containing protein [Caulobacterales bacterium]